MTFRIFLCAALAALCVSLTSCANGSDESEEEKQLMEATYGGLKIRMTCYSGVSTSTPELDIARLVNNTDKGISITFNCTARGTSPCVEVSIFPVGNTVNYVFLKSLRVDGTCSNAKLAPANTYYDGPEWEFGEDKIYDKKLGFISFYIRPKQDAPSSFTIQNINVDLLTPSNVRDSESNIYLKHKYPTGKDFVAVCGNGKTEYLASTPLGGLCASKIAITTSKGERRLQALAPLATLTELEQREWSDIYFRQGLI